LLPLYLFFALAMRRSAEAAHYLRAQVSRLRLLRLLGVRTPRPPTETPAPSKKDTSLPIRDAVAAIAGDRHFLGLEAGIEGC
jgi:hypothetical protein